jgi:ankyrin repeat protein
VLEVCKLLESGINPNMFNRYGETPLHICKNEQIAKLLINYGAKLHTKDHFGFTPADRREL